MKNSFLIAFVLFIAASTVSCDHRSGTDASTSQVVTSGSWKITLFSERGSDETADFNGYTFNFLNNGTVTAVRNGNAVNGTWSVNTSSNEFKINLGPKTDANKPLGELTDDWNILSRTETEIRLTDDNSSSAEFLTFTKN